jgi:hypothetical protein
MEPRKFAGSDPATLKYGEAAEIFAHHRRVYEYSQRGSAQTVRP